MAQILGLGGIFFKCADRAKLTAWYQEHLGMQLSEHGSIEFFARDLPKGAYAVWGPFVDDTEYFLPSQKEFMINLMVDDVEGVLERARAGSAEIVGEIEEYDFGRFGWFVDPEGNKIELWQPLGDES